MISRLLATLTLLIATQGSATFAQVADATRVGVSRESLRSPAPVDAHPTRGEITAQVSSSAPPGEQVVIGALLGALAGVAATALYEGHCEATAKQEKDMCGLAYVLIGVPAVGVGTVSGIMLTSLHGSLERWTGL